MKRREFVTLLGGAAIGWPVAANAQQAAKVARIGYLATALADSHYVQACLPKLPDLGYVEAATS